MTTGRDATYKLDTASVDCTLTLEEWRRLTGFDPEAGDYTAPQEDVPSPYVTMRIGKGPR